MKNLFNFFGKETKSIDTFKKLAMDVTDLNSIRGGDGPISGGEWEEEEGQP